MELSQLCQKSYDKLTDYLFFNEDMNIYDIVVEVKLNDGRTVRISYKDNQDRLAEQESICKK